MASFKKCIERNRSKYLKRYGKSDYALPYYALSYLRSGRAKVGRELAQAENIRLSNDGGTAGNYRLLRRTQAVRDANYRIENAVSRYDWETEVQWKARAEAARADLANALRGLRRCF